MTSARFTYGGGHFCRQALPLAAYAHRTVRAATRSTGARVARAARLSREEHQGSPGKSAGPWAQEAEQENTHEGVAAAEAGVGVASYALGDSCCSLAQCATLADLLRAQPRPSLKSCGTFLMGQVRSWRGYGLRDADARGRRRRGVRRLFCGAVFSAGVTAAAFAPRRARWDLVGGGETLPCAAVALALTPYGLLRSRPFIKKHLLHYTLSTTATRWERSHPSHRHCRGPPPTRTPASTSAHARMSRDALARLQALQSFEMAPPRRPRPMGTCPECHTRFDHKPDCSKNPAKN